MATLNRVQGCALAVCLLLLSACDAVNFLDRERDDGGMRTFKFEAHGDTFLARTSDPEVIRTARSQLALPENKRLMHVNGTIARGQGYNTGWSWHFVPGAWRLVEMSIEVCDATPSYVQENLSYFADTLKGHYCPWGARVIAEVGAR